MDHKNVRPSQVLLDPQNPRLPDGTSNDKEAINRLLEEGYGQLLALARDMADRGEGNPAELPIVIADGSKYVVLEGNRRFAALKLLKDPMLADDPAHRLAFKRIGRGGRTPPKWLFSTIVDTREEADHWITLRHTGANSGVGVRGWSAPQSALHRRRMNAPIDSGTVRSIAIADELEETYQADTELVELIKKVRKTKMTNIGRFFSAAILVRLQLSLRSTSDNGGLVLFAKYSATDLREFFGWIFDFLDKNSVDAIKNDAIRNELLDENARRLPDPSMILSDFYRLSDLALSGGKEVESDPTADDGQNFAGTGGSSGMDGESQTPSPGGAAEDPAAEPDVGDEQRTVKDKGRQRDVRPERTLYSQVRVPNLSPAVQRVLREARSLPIDENYGIACVLARVIVELIVSDPKVLEWSGKKESDTLAKKIRGCIYTLDPNIDSPQKRSRQDLVQVNLEVDRLGVVYMHQFMHNPMAKADPHLARTFSMIFTPLLNSINEAVV